MYSGGAVPSTTCFERAKLGFLRDGLLDDKRAARAASTARFAPLADFLESIPAACNPVNALERGLRAG